MRKSKPPCHETAIKMLEKRATNCTAIEDALGARFWQGAVYGIKLMLDKSIMNRVRVMKAASAIDEKMVRRNAALCRAAENEHKKARAEGFSNASQMRSVRRMEELDDFNRRLSASRGVC